MEPVQTPSLDHDEFDRMVAGIDEFQPLPAQPVPLAQEPPETDDSHLGELILNGLVSPV